MSSDSSATALQLVLKQLTARKVPGLSVMVMQRDQVMVEEAVGLADLAGGRSATLGMVYLWFLMTKIVTATAALQLVERGRLSLDHPVERYLPEFPRPGAGWPKVELRHVLSHSSGLANPIPVRWVHPANQPAREAHGFTLELLSRYHKLRFPAGSKASYSNLGYLALGSAVTIHHPGSWRGEPATGYRRTTRPDPVVGREPERHWGSTVVRRGQHGRRWPSALR
jgi:CubicO group peptidase (beta-lactamase class C family)